MSNIRSAFAAMTAPGVRTVETTQGYRVLTIASHTAVYMIGSSSNGPTDEPTLVTSLSDFTNQFGGSPSEASVELLFRNDPQSTLFFTRCNLTPRATVTIDDALAGDYELLISGTSVTYTATATDTEGDIASGLIAAVNASPAGAGVKAYPGSGVNSLVVRKNSGTTLTVSVEDGDMTALVSTPTTATVQDYIGALENGFDKDDDLPQGFLIAPEAFSQLTSATDRAALGSVMESLCQSDGFDWVAIVDGAPGQDTVAKVQAEAEQYVTVKGHLWFTAPYVVNLDGNTIPSSAGVCGIATRRFRSEGYQQPAAGARFPMRGVTDVETRFNTTQQGVLNPIGVNVIRNLRNKGVVVWGMRTRASDPLYRFGMTRVVFNVLNGTLRGGFDLNLFTSIDGQGVLLARVEETARSVCQRMWQAGALFGQTSSEAYSVVCSFENNDADSLELGEVLLEVYAVPAPGMEKLLINTVRVGAGQVQQVAASGRLPD